MPIMALILHPLGAGVGGVHEGLAFTFLYKGRLNVGIKNWDGSFFVDLAPLHSKICFRRSCRRQW